MTCGCVIYSHRFTLCPLVPQCIIQIQKKALCTLELLGLPYYETFPNESCYQSKLCSSGNRIVFYESKVHFGSHMSILYEYTSSSISSPDNNRGYEQGMTCLASESCNGYDVSKRKQYTDPQIFSTQPIQHASYYASIYPLVLVFFYYNRVQRLNSKGQTIQPRNGERGHNALDNCSEKVDLHVYGCKCAIKALLVVMSERLHTVLLRFLENTPYRVQTYI